MKGESVASGQGVLGGWGGGIVFGVVVPFPKAMGWVVRLGVPRSLPPTACVALCTIDECN